MKTQQLPWQPLRTGVQHKLLDRRSDQDLQLDLMQLEPNARLPLHQHPQFEWAYVLRGSFTDHRGTFTTGDFILNEAGSQHEASTGAEGAELLVVWCGRVTSVNV